MGYIGFGTASDATCLQDLSEHGPNGEPLCLAFRVAYHQLVLPAYVTDEGYVILNKGTNKFTRLSADTIAALQQQGTLSSPLPAYSLPTYSYVYGYSLWPALLVIVLLVLRRRRRARAAVVSAATRAPVAAPAEGTARIEVTTGYSPMAFLYGAFQPTIEINDDVHRRPWGLASFDVAPGSYTVAASYPWLLSRRCGRNAVTFDVAAGEIKRVSYRASMIRFVPGRMHVEAVLPPARVVERSVRDE